MTDFDIRSRITKLWIDVAIEIDARKIESAIHRKLTAEEMKELEYLFSDEYERFIDAREEYCNMIIERELSTPNKEVLLANALCYMEEQGFTTEDLAKYLGCSETYVKKIIEN